MIKKLLFILIFLISTSSAAIFEENFDSVKPGNFSSCSPNIVFSDSKLYWGTEYENSYCYKYDFNFTDFYISNDMAIINGEYYESIFLYDSSFDYSIGVIVINNTQGYYSNEGEMVGAQLWIEYYDGINDTYQNINDHFLDLSVYESNGKVNWGISRISESEFSILVDDETISSYTVTPNSGIQYIYEIDVNGWYEFGSISIDNFVITDNLEDVSAINCTNLDFSGISSWDVAGYIQVVISWLYDFPPCYINPIYDYISNTADWLKSVINWFLNGLYGIGTFIASIGLLLVSILGLLTGIFESIASSNIYAATLFGLIFTSISLVFALRVYNIIAGTTIWGFKLPKL